MKNENKQFTYTAEDIFEEIPGDPDNVMMKLPPEVLELMGWKEGDVLDINLEGDQIVIKKP